MVPASPLLVITDKERLPSFEQWSAHSTRFTGVSSGAMDVTLGRTLSMSTPPFRNTRQFLIIYNAFPRWVHPHSEYSIWPVLCSFGVLPLKRELKCFLAVNAPGCVSLVCYLVDLTFLCLMNLGIISMLKPLKRSVRHCAHMPEQ